MSVGYRIYASMVSLFVALAVLSPLLRDPREDSFPLSTYPMFSTGRADPTLVLTHALGVRGDGSRFPLPPMVSTGNREVLQSQRTIHREVFGGSARRGAFCAEIASRIGASLDPSLADVERVELVTSRFDSVAYFREGPEPAARRRRAACEVPR